jgi:hypothetical protein
MEIEKYNATAAEAVVFGAAAVVRLEMRRK